MGTRMFCLRCSLFASLFAVAAFSLTCCGGGGTGNGDAGDDAAVDAGQDATPDAGGDESTDAGEDAAQDAGGDESTDAGEDAAPDAGGDHPADAGGDEAMADDDPCASVVCDTPPSAVCLDASTLRTYRLPGSCINGACSYAFDDTECVRGCVGGACVPPYPDKRVGIFYLAWHAYATDAISQIPPPDRLTVEDVIRDTDTSFGDMILNHGLMGQAHAFHYHVKPEIGYYCLYRARPGAPPYDEPLFVPDCPGISDVATQHAVQLWSAGVDFVYIDSTNLPFFNPFADVLALRPIEVLFEEWRALRDQGIMTPQIAVWLPIPAKQAGQEELVYLYEKILELYNRPEWSDLLLRDEPSGKKIMFIVDHPGLPPDPANEAAIRSNGGRNDIETVHLWGLLDAAAFSAGKAAWMQPCATSDGTFTTLIESGVPCNQGYTTNSPIGTVVSVSTSYQLGYASLPFQSPGKQNGLTLKKQFETAFAVQPDYLLINSWNEFVAQPQPNPFESALGDLAKSMGMIPPPQTPGDTSAYWLWVDPYGAEFVRDIEPTVEYGSAYYDLMQSCIRVYRSGAPACTPDQVATEPCCQLQDEYLLVYSLRVEDPDNALDTHHVLTVARNEVDTLIASGAWEQVCNPVHAPPGLCAQSSSLSADGPFLLFAAGGPGRTPLYRCWTGVANFFSPDPECEGTEVVGLLGYISQSRSSHSPRPLCRCYNPGAVVHFHWLGEHCPAGFNHESVLGFVR